MNKLKFLPLLAALSACAHAPGTVSYSPEPITASGSAAVEASGEQAARAKAVLDAQRAALERAANLFMDEEARSGGRDVLEVGLLNTPQLYVEKRKIVTERREGDMYRVTVRAWIHLGKLYSALRSMKLAGPAASAPSAAFALRGEGVKPLAEPFLESFGRRSRIRFKEFPFTSDAALLAGPDAALVEAAAGAGADLLFLVSASVASSGAGLSTDFHPSRAEAGLKVYDADTGEELLSASSRASSIDSSQAASFSKSLSSAGELLAQEAAARSSKLSSGAEPVQIKVFGVDGLETLEKLRDQLQTAGLESLRAESYSDGIAVFNAVPLRSDPHELASDVLRSDSFGLELEGAVPGEIRFSLPR